MAATLADAPYWMYLVHLSLALPLLGYTRLVRHTWLCAMPNGRRHPAGGETLPTP